MILAGLSIGGLLDTKNADPGQNLIYLIIKLYWPCCSVVSFVWIYVSQ